MRQHAKNEAWSDVFWRGRYFCRIGSCVFSVGHDTFLFNGACLHFWCSSSNGTCLTLWLVGACSHCHVFLFCFSGGSDRLVYIPRRAGHTTQDGAREADVAATRVRQLIQSASRIASSVRVCSLSPSRSQCSRKEAKCCIRSRAGVVGTSFVLSAPSAVH